MSIGHKKFIAHYHLRDDELDCVYNGVTGLRG